MIVDILCFSLVVDDSMNHEHEPRIKKKYVHLWIDELYFNGLNSAFKDKYKNKIPL